MPASSRNSSRQSSPRALKDFEYSSRYVPAGNIQPKGYYICPDTIPSCLNVRNAGGLCCEKIARDGSGEAVKAHVKWHEDLRKEAAAAAERSRSRGRSTGRRYDRAAQGNVPRTSQSPSLGASSKPGTPRMASMSPSSKTRQELGELGMSRGPAPPQKAFAGAGDGRSGSQSRASRAGLSGNPVHPNTKKRAGQDELPAEERGRPRQKTFGHSQTPSPDGRRQGKEPARTASPSTAATATAAAISIDTPVGTLLDLALARQVPASKLDFLIKPLNEDQKQNRISMRTLLFHYQNMTPEDREKLPGRSISIKNFAERLHRYKLNEKVKKDTYKLFETLHEDQNTKDYKRYREDFALESYFAKLPVPVLAANVTDGDRAKHPLIMILETLGDAQLARSPYKRLHALQNPSLPAIQAAYGKDRDSFKKLLDKMTYHHLHAMITRNAASSVEGPQLRILRKWVNNHGTLPAQQKAARSSASSSRQGSPSARSTSQHSPIRRPAA